METKKNSMSDEIFVCIPSYNAESTIEEAIKQCKKFATSVLVINDGSSDKTEEIAKKAGAEIITHKQNKGYGGSIKTGLSEALRRRAKVTITFDADLQHDSNDLPKIIQPILTNKADIVIGSRFLEDNDNVKPYRKFGIKLITRLVNSFSKNNIRDAESGLRAYNYESLKKIVPSLETQGMGMSAEILLKAAVNQLKIIEIPRKEMYPDNVQTSSQNPLKHGLTVVLTIIKLIIETKPLPAFGIPSLVFFFITGISSYFVVEFYNEIGRLPVGLTIFTLSTLTIAFFLIMVATILYVLSRISAKLNFQLHNDLNSNN
ncbi:glycosyltransferase family 2 protein [Nitrosopumilus maritimus]|nr:glycosyltransferase family 2 protein [Nitrosopumilus maritimus]